MRDGDNSNEIAVAHINNGVWETIDQYPTMRQSNRRTRIGELPDKGNYAFDLVGKGFAEANHP